MRRFCFAAYASVVLVSALAVAEQAPKRASRTGCHGFLVHVANGQPVQTFCTESKSTKQLAAAASQTPANGIVIYNGNQKQTRTFSSATDPHAPAHNLPPAVIAVVSAGTKSPRPVVVGISSSSPVTRPVVVGIASSGSTTQPVVLNVASDGFQTAGPVEPVAIAVSPRPAKRPPYRPAALDRQ